MCEEESKSVGTLPDNGRPDDPHTVDHDLQTDDHDWTSDWTDRDIIGQAYIDCISIPWLFRPAEGWRVT